jgi:hypothetical protein
LESWNNGIVENWNNKNEDKGSILPSFQYSNIPFFHARSFLRQGHDDVGVPGAIEV